MRNVKVYFETYGCTMNKADTEVMAGIVEGEYTIVENPEECDIAVINSCGVIAFTEHKIVKRISELRGQDKKVVLAGCIPSMNPDVNVEVEGLIGPRNLDLIGEALMEVAKGNTYRNTAPTDTIKVGIPKRTAPGVIATIPISEGCLGACTYCGTKRARGTLKSFPSTDITSEAAANIKNGYREIRLTAQDTGIYGVDSGKRLPGLLTDISSIQGDFRVRVGMMNPQHIQGILLELVEAFRHPKVFKFLHLPLQSGDDRVLGEMKRGYTLEEFLTIVDAFRTAIPNLTLSTDVIVGYPTEDEDSFKKTFSVIEDLAPDILNITRFSPRPGTPAALLKDMPDRFKKDRSREFTGLHSALSEKKNKTFLGKTFPALVAEKGKGKTLLARLDNYKQVVVEEASLGDMIEVEIVESTPTYLVGRSTR
jgi:MiaB-like tRNA modifying enzyme